MPEKPSLECWPKETTIWDTMRPYTISMKYFWVSWQLYRCCNVVSDKSRFTPSWSSERKNAASPKAAFRSSRDSSKLQVFQKIWRREKRGEKIKKKVSNKPTLWKPLACGIDLIATSCPVLERCLGANAVFLILELRDNENRPRRCASVNLYLYYTFHHFSIKKVNSQLPKPNHIQYFTHFAQEQSAGPQTFALVHCSCATPAFCEGKHDRQKMLSKGHQLMMLAHMEH